METNSKSRQGLIFLLIQGGSLLYACLFKVEPKPMKAYEHLNIYARETR